MIRRRHKYDAQRARSADGCRLYASGAERDRAEELRLFQSAGEISALEEQPTVKLTPTITYRPDFVYLEHGRVIYEDVKGFETREFSIKRRLWALGLGPAVLRILKRDRRSRAFVVTREVQPGTYRLVDEMGIDVRWSGGRT